MSGTGHTIYVLEPTEQNLFCDSCRTSLRAFKFIFALPCTWFCTYGQCRRRADAEFRLVAAERVALKGAGGEVDEQQEERWRCKNSFASASSHLLADSISMTDATLVVEPKID